MANVEARLAAIRHRGEDESHPRTTEDDPDELFRRAEEHLDLAFAHGTTAERLAIRGSFFKKKATTATNRRSRNSLIRRAHKAYDKAIDKAADSGVLSVYHASLAIQMASLLDVDGDPATSQPRHAAMLERLEEQLPYLDTTREPRTSAPDPSTSRRPATSSDCDWEMRGFSRRSSAASPT